MKRSETVLSAEEVPLIIVGSSVGYSRFVRSSKIGIEIGICGGRRQLSLSRLSSLPARGS